jgi:hypothetical protein
VPQISTRIFRQLLQIPLMENPDRLKAVHMRHENIDDHQIEHRIIESVEAGFSAVGDDNLKSSFFEPGTQLESAVLNLALNAQDAMPSEVDPGPGTRDRRN